MHVVLVDDNELLAKGRAAELREAGHSAVALVFDQALVWTAAKWAQADVAVVDANDTRTEGQRTAAREATGAQYEAPEHLLGVKVVRRVREVSPATIVLVVTTYAEPDGDPYVVELFVQAGAHYILPHSAVQDAASFLAEVEEPSPEHRAALLPPAQREMLGLRPDNDGPDLLDAYDWLLRQPSAVRAYLLHGRKLTSSAVRTAAERQVRSATEQLGDQLVGKAYGGTRRAVAIRKVLGHLFTPEGRRRRP